MPIFAIRNTMFFYQVRNYRFWQFSDHSQVPMKYSSLVILRSTIEATSTGTTNIYTSMVFGFAEAQ